MTTNPQSTAGHETGAAQTTIAFPNAKPGDIALEVTDDSMSPDYPIGTIVLARPSKMLSNGNRVVAIGEDGKVLIRVFQKIEDAAVLHAIKHDEPSTAIIRKDNIHLYKIIQSIRNEDHYDEAMRVSDFSATWQSKLSRRKRRRNPLELEIPETEYSVEDHEAFEDMRKGANAISLTDEDKEIFQELESSIQDELPENNTTR